MPYNRQLIVHANPDGTIRSGSEKLSDKATAGGLETETVELPVSGHGFFRKAQVFQKLRQELANLNAESRLYIRGHGHWVNQTVGGVGAEEWARTLVEAGMPMVKIVSVCACRAARDAGTTANAPIDALSADSFAWKFHKELGDRGLKVWLYARAYKVVVRSDPRGTKHTSDRGDYGPGTGGRVHKRATSKLLFAWSGNRQVRKWVDYDNDDPSEWVEV